MTETPKSKRAAFRKLHDAGCFVIPNPWDVGSAIALQSLGFKALASTSAGMAWSMGRSDNCVERDDVLGHLHLLAGRTDIPVNADFENGFAHDADGVATNVALAVATGIAGLSVEDSTGDAAAPLYDLDLAVRRFAAARAAIDRTGADVMLTARSEGFIRGRPDIAETLRRLSAYAAAGADCLFAPGLADPEHIRAVVQAVAPKPVNLISPGLSVAAVAALGVRRISVGGSLARVAWAGFLAAAQQIAADGVFDAFAGGTSGAQLNRIFSDAPT